MKSPHKIRRIQRQFAQGTSAEPINIVSLIDIFAILVFYLLVSIAAVEMRPIDPNLTLPQSTSQDRPKPTVTQLTITRKEILLNHRRVMFTRDAATNTDAFLAPLKSAFLANVGVLNTANGQTRGEVNILADKSIPYALLKKVMATCSEVQVARVSLAVIQQTGTQP